MSRRTAESNKAILAAWNKEQELVQEGKGTREWTYQQQKDILDKGKAYDENGVAFQGQHMKSVEKYPECHIFFDTNRIIESDYSVLHVIDKGADSVDFAILNNCKDGNIIITKGGGLAAMALAKNTFVISSNGFEYTKSNVNLYLIRAKIVRHTKSNQVKGLIDHKAEQIPFKKLLYDIIKKSNEGEEK